MNKLNRTIIATLIPVMLTGCDDAVNSVADAVFVDFIGGALEEYGEHMNNVFGRDPKREDVNTIDDNGNSVIVMPQNTEEVETGETSEPVAATTVASAEPVTETVEVEEESETLVVFIEPVTESENDNNTVIEDVTYDEDLPIAEIIADAFAESEEDETPFTVTEDQTTDAEIEERSFQVDFNPNRNPNLGWADSYSVGNRCYIHSTFDHGAGDLVVDTPYGEMTVYMVNQTIGAGPGIDKADAIYNDVQCGNGPANDVGDEIVGECPGRVDMGGAGCGTIGYGWFDYLELDGEV